MTGKRYSLLVLSTFAAAGLLAGCAGGSAPSASPNALPFTASQVQPVSAGIFFDAKCKKDNGVSVKPCSVSLTVSAPTADVTVKAPKSDTITDNDKICSKKDIATVAGADDAYVVTAGLKSGSCSVIFTAKSGGKTVGTATLSIKNTAA
jgi:hypothetical protein